MRLYFAVFQNFWKTLVLLMIMCLTLKGNLYQPERGFHKFCIELIFILLFTSNNSKPKQAEIFILWDKCDENSVKVEVFFLQTIKTRFNFPCNVIVQITCITTKILSWNFLNTLKIGKCYHCVKFRQR